MAVGVQGCPLTSFLFSPPFCSNPLLSKVLHKNKVFTTAYNAVRRSTVISDEVLCLAKLWSIKKCQKVSVKNANSRRTIAQTKMYNFVQICKLPPVLLTRLFVFWVLAGYVTKNIGTG